MVQFELVVKAAVPRNLMACSLVPRPLPRFQCYTQREPRDEANGMLKNVFLRPKNVMSTTEKIIHLKQDNKN